MLTLEPFETMSGNWTFEAFDFCVVDCFFGRFTALERRLSPGCLSARLFTTQLSPPPLM
jgi:hypothetical protein